MFFKLLLSFGVALSCACLSSCTLQQPVLTNPKAIEVKGILELFPGGYGAASVRVIDGKCYDLALPKSVMREHDRWSERVVILSGTTVLRPRFPDAAWFDIKDRRIEAGGCSDSVIYVDTIKVVK
ncbi:hypothetical protein K4L06_14435 [Lysobacter sp. BMK333-48F3]|uniref:hypothetical protein n=1 Tax=Lysobacter sp. BMK333-48F3 TaxID=2867962 RepID=UPI001C8C8DEF|nr:hypothetical protein [Lysobacter sp. BMK333-48F3]MBX9402507.1 hypothetical protein [Lysobacter sp. BMK333-48F3]